MSTLKWPLLAYVIVCIIVIFLPASQGYDVVSWKLLVGQIYAIPAFIIVFIIVYFRRQRT